MDSQIATYSAHDAAEITGLTKTMIDYLCRHDLIVPTTGVSRGRGKRRLYSFGDLVMLRALAKMLISGLSVSKFQTSLVKLRNSHSLITLSSLPGTHLLVEDERIYIKKYKEMIDMLSSGRLTCGFVLDLESLRREVVDRIYLNGDGE